jgi:hypothetical protein
MGVRRGQRQEVTKRLPDDAMILAIFDPEPYLVVTDARPITNRPSAWMNPFMAGRPNSVVFFDA